jgi:signal transduction histidine kinase
MKPKVVIIFLLLVVLPTAMLTFVANLSFRNWETILQRRLEVGASSAIDSVAAKVEGSLDRVASDLAAAFADPLSRDGKDSDFAVTAIRLRARNPIIRQAYLYLNPWGFVWPEERADEDPSEHKHREAVLEALRREATVAGPLATMLRPEAGAGSCVFRAISGRPNLYCGFEIDSEELIVQMDKAMAEASHDGIKLQTESPISEDRDVGGDVLVQDSFDLKPEVAERSERRGLALLAQGRLRKPLNSVRVSAYLTDSAEVRQREAQKGRLYGWSILLLAAGIVVGVWLVLRQAALEIHDARKRSELMMSVSHDLRTPVASMKMLAESLFFNTVTDAEKRSKFLGTIIRECERLNQLVERVLFLVRFGQNAMVYAIRELDPGKLVSDTVHLFRARFSEDGPVEHRVDVELHVGTELPVVHGDRTALTQLLLNLMDNAEKYSRKKARAALQMEGEEPGLDAAVNARESGAEPLPVRIEVSVRRVERPGFLGPREWVEIAVKDHGIGMEQAELRRIFRRFYRVADARRDHVAGVGLGLAMCRHVAESHGGWIEVDSVPDAGSEFRVVLPVGRDNRKKANGERNSP